MKIDVRIGNKYKRCWITISIVVVILLVFEKHLSPILSGYNFWLCTAMLLFIFTTILGSVKYNEEREEEICQRKRYLYSGMTMMVII